VIFEVTLEKLTPGHRTVILLKDFDSRCEEIGVMLNIPVGTVRGRIPWARLELREHLLLLAERSDKRLLEAAEKAVDG